MVSIQLNQCLGQVRGGVEGGGEFNVTCFFNRQSLSCLWQREVTYCPTQQGTSQDPKSEKFGSS